MSRVQVWASVYGQRLRASGVGLRLQGLNQGLKVYGSACELRSKFRLRASLLGWCIAP